MATRQPSAGRSFAYLGYGAVIVGLGGVLAAIFLAPWFSVFTDALSFLGIPGIGTALLFNGSLIVAGALGAGFVAYLWTVTDRPFHVASIPFLLLAMLSMSLVGVFPIPAAAHGLVAVSFFVLLTLGVFLWGLGDYAAGLAGRAAALVLLSVLHVFSWIWWLLFPWFPPGIAVPELVGVAALAVWGLWVSADVHGLTVGHS